MTLRDSMGDIAVTGAQLRTWFSEQPRPRQILIILGTSAVAIIGILALVFHQHLIAILKSLSETWKNIPFGRTILFILVFVVGFPPLLGFLALLILCGMVYGFPWGWPLLAGALVSGSFASFLVYRYFLHNQAVYWVNHNEKFRAFSEILHENNSLILITLIRLCPFPYLLSNGALSAIPELRPQTFLLALIVTLPKLLVHLFVGLKIKELGDTTKSSGHKIIDIVSILVTAAATTVTTYVIYDKMKQKLTEYHRNGENYDNMIFGNFEDDELNIELHLNDYDADNLVMDDAGIDDARRSHQQERLADPRDFEISDEDDEEIRL